MEISLVQQDLEHIDGLDVDTLLLHLPENEAPLQGLGGLVDWRLAGRLSRFMMKGWITGAMAQAHLMPTNGRLPFARLVAIGVGRLDNLTLQLIEELAELSGGTLQDAKVQSFACSLLSVSESAEDRLKAFYAFKRGVSKSFDGRVVLMGDHKVLREAVGDRTG